MDEEYITQLIQKTHRFLRIRPRSTKEIYNYLHRTMKRNRGEVDEVVVDEIIRELLDLRLLDDTAFCKWWIDERLYFRPKSTYVLKGELKQKGVPDNIINTAIRKANISDSKLAIKALKKKKKLLDVNKKETAIAFLLRRGFSWSDARSAFEELVEKEYNRT